MEFISLGGLAYNNYSASIKVHQEDYLMTLSIETFSVPMERELKEIVDQSLDEYDFDIEACYEDWSENSINWTIPIDNDKGPASLERLFFTVIKPDVDDWWLDKEQDVPDGCGDGEPFDSLTFHRNEEQCIVFSPIKNQVMVFTQGLS